MEIEVKLQYNNKGAIIKLLKSNQFQLIKKITLKDHYFGQGHTSMSDANGLYRIREIDHKEYELTYKNKISEKNKITKREEINLKIDNYNAANKILQSLGCKLIKINYSKKEIWRKNDTLVEFITNLKPQKLQLIEIEAKTKKSVNYMLKLLDKYIMPVGEEIFNKK